MEFKKKPQTIEIFGYEVTLMIANRKHTMHFEKYTDAVKAAADYDAPVIFVLSNGEKLAQI